MAKIKNKHVVIGLGKTGLSCVRFLKRLDCEVAVIDTRTEPPGRQELAQEFPTVQLYCGELEQFDLSKAQELVVSPGIAISTPAIAKAIAAGVPCSGDVELFAKSVDAPVIAVTGSNGKSTVVSIIGKALEALGYNVCVAGNIGLPVLDALSTALVRAPAFRRNCSPSRGMPIQATNTQCPTTASASLRDAQTQTCQSHIKATRNQITAPWP